MRHSWHLRACAAGRLRVLLLLRGRSTCLRCRLLLQLVLFRQLHHALLHC
jgi:hypothetical protein